MDRLKPSKDWWCVPPCKSDGRKRGKYVYMRFFFFTFPGQKRNPKLRKHSVKCDCSWSFVDLTVSNSFKSGTCHLRKSTCVSIINLSLSVTCGRSVVFCGYFGFLHQLSWPARYNWNIGESDVKYRNHIPPNKPEVCMSVVWFLRYANRASNLKTE